MYETTYIGQVSGTAKKGEIKRSTIERMQLILQTLKSNSNAISLRETSRQTSIPVASVARIVDDYMQDFLEITGYSTLGLKIRLIRLKKEFENVSVIDIVNRKNLKRKIRGFQS